MSEVLSLEHFSISTTGPTLTMSVGSGQSLAVVGPAASGKSTMLRVLAGQERVAQGSFKIRGAVAIATPGALSRRSKVQSIAKNDASSDRASEALTITRLWDQRHAAVSELSTSQLAAAELLELLAGDADLALIDGQLDLLDPWTLSSVLDSLKARKSMTFVVATHRPELLARVDALVVLKDQQVRFAGSPSDLLRHKNRHELTLTTENQPGVRAIASPFEVSIKSDGNEMKLSTAEGQELAARLLLEGYGDINLVASRPPTIEEALLGL
ncbi:MAG: ATP-binding cassette domain-containing protein [Fimbriimonas sp.]